MLLSTFKTVFAILAAAGAVSALPRRGDPCSSPGSYDCIDDFYNVGICSTLGRWEVAASSTEARGAWPGYQPSHAGFHRYGPGRAGARRKN
ncbi:hypothetical protein VTJ49DRAFT_3295 [Mycothermus thermophilus]|uniref:Uncharacterized protein n=1 Tax=Humicola insolens TaxID=85995 RepID=A0ABR3V7T5_HUMIN